jgi:hypothetical protein
MKTSELIGDALDWAVTRANFEVNYETVWRDCREECNFSTEWAHGGPIIEREGIELLCESLGFRWVAMPQKGPEWRGPTPLVAAMRCYVAACLGDEVEIPEELK